MKDRQVPIHCERDRGRAWNSKAAFAARPKSWRPGLAATSGRNLCSAGSAGRTRA